MSKNYSVPGYETTYNHFYKAYCTREKDLNISNEKKIIHISELDAEVCKTRHFPCHCSEITEIKKNPKCDLKKWTYLANAKTEYTDKLGSLWANFTLKSTLPMRPKRGMDMEEMEKLVPADSPTYIYTLEDSQNRKECYWWVDALTFPDDLQCRIAREYQKRQFLLTEKQLKRKS